MIKKRVFRKYIMLFSIILLVLVIQNMPTSRESLNYDSPNQTVMENIDQVNETSIMKLREWYQNPDIIGRVYIENTNIQPVLVKGVDNNYYQNHNIWKKPDLMGAIFLDTRNHLSDQKLIIYNYHEEKEDTLKRMMLESFYPEHSRIHLETLEGTYTYHIFSIIRDKGNYQKIRSEFTELEWKAYLEEIQEKSLYDTRMELKETDDILVLQSNSYDGYYIKIFGKRIKNS